MLIEDKRIALVVPTIRENCFRDFCERWGKINLFSYVDLIVMEDNPNPTFDANSIVEKFYHKKVIHLSWKNIDEDLGSESWIIPRRSDTVRSFGYLFAYKNNYEYTLTLDDDCYPPNVDADGLEYSDASAFLNEHIKNLNQRSKWFNTLNSVKPRGIPFYNVGKNESVVINHGLWTNVIDYDAPYQLANPVKEEFSYDNVIVPSGMYFPMCGMNVMWKTKYTVLMYHMLMGSIWNEKNKQLDKLVFDRFGDIWCGIIAKKICDMLNFSISTGMPYIRHERASNPFTNLKKEAYGIEVNEKFWEYVDSIAEIIQLQYSNKHIEYVKSNYQHIGNRIAVWDQYPEHKDYFKMLGKAMFIWADLF